ncbi:hypothetical protein TNIN_325801 [Trichonephila inaurata madagascariensis]|uniref:Uncharacterized protein n=1 Tax=Trichonephila inaurata madagascariensis TaxID=2747483 RepID=A0A8X6MDU6_9ARAC|nr:hypothetical protein TNIN_325801 [Trichonephila inaurata madagascariensis]
MFSLEVRGKPQDDAPADDAPPGDAPADDAPPGDAGDAKAAAESSLQRFEPYELLFKTLSTNLPILGDPNDTNHFDLESALHLTTILVSDFNRYRHVIDIV